MSQELEVKVITTKRRNRTASARMVGNVLHVRVPASMPEANVQEIVKNFKRRFEKRQRKMELSMKEDLKAISDKLNKKHFGGIVDVAHIEYTTEQSRIFGSCDTKTRTIRISHRVAEMPRWVRDYVIVHEMAHILERNHNRNFWELVNRYKLAERARGFLIAKGLDEDGDPDGQTDRS